MLILQVDKGERWKKKALFCGVWGLILADSWPTPGQDAHSASDEMFVIYEKIYEKGENRERERETEGERENERERGQSLWASFSLVKKKKKRGSVTKKK